MIFFVLSSWDIPDEVIDHSSSFTCCSLNGTYLISISEFHHGLLSSFQKDLSFPIFPSSFTSSCSTWVLPCCLPTQVNVWPSLSEKMNVQGWQQKKTFSNPSAEGEHFSVFKFRRGKYLPTQLVLVLMLKETESVATTETGCLLTWLLSLYQLMSCS